MLLICWKWKVMFRDRDSKGNEELPAAAYLYEHREEADHHQLVMDLRSLLFGVRKLGF